MAGLRQLATVEKVGVMALVRLLSAGSETPKNKGKCSEDEGYRVDAPLRVSSCLYACMHNDMWSHDSICAGEERIHDKISYLFRIREQNRRRKQGTR